MKPSTRDALIFSGLLFVCSLLCSSDALGQSFGPYSLTGSQCAAVTVEQHSTATYQVIGSWTGTIQPKLSVAGQSAVNAQATPTNSTTAQVTLTANGAYFTTVSGYSTFVLCGNTITGTAKIYLNLSNQGH